MRSFDLCRESNSSDAGQSALLCRSLGRESAFSTMILINTPIKEI
jgi:hypothetical protein